VPLEAVCSTATLPWTACVVCAVTAGVVVDVAIVGAITITALVVHVVAVLFFCGGSNWCVGVLVSDNVFLSIRWSAVAQASLPVIL